MSLPPLGLFSDEDCLEWLRSTKFLEPGSMVEHLSREELLQTHPVLKHLVEGTPQALSINMVAPDRPLVPLDEPDTVITLHEIIRSVGGNSNSPSYVLLNFGSYS